MFRISNLLIKFKGIRSFSSSNTHILEQLSNRQLIRVSGNEVTEFLQGLITNDIHHLALMPSAMYSMILNTKGRVLCDTLIYRTNEENTFLMECDKEIAPMLQKHLKLYRVRRKISIDSLEDSLSVHVAYDPKTSQENPLKVSAKEEIQTTPVEAKTAKIHKDLFLFRDPRIATLGIRIIAPNKCEVSSQLKDLNLTTATLEDEKTNYRKFRYGLGVGEGVIDLPPGDCFPLEANCDYLHGVSFHKGCYVGQELTARTFHTGVTRKRLMPLIFSKIPTNLPEDNKILAEKVNLGKFRGIEQNVGLALLRITQALDKESIPIGDGIAKTLKPNWWPIEAPKEKMSNVQK